MNRPNVLTICVDHWPGLLLGCMGHPVIQTPTLNRIAASGTLFTQAYSTTPTCIPARRALMTGTSAKTHNDRVFSQQQEMPAHLPTLSQVFRNHGYQAVAVGKLHVYPQRDRIGFDEVILHEEGRHQFDGRLDDFELFLKHQGYAGQEMTHAMGNNEYVARPWHLPEFCHPTNWATREMCRMMQRRDPRKPAFWYCSYAAPHPPLTPPRDYWDLYMNLGIDDPVIGDWAQDLANWPYALRTHNDKHQPLSTAEARLARTAFYAQCTYIDHQIRLLIGTLREEGLLDNTIILFTSDHGDMLGNHNLWAKPPMLEWSVKIPLILLPNADNPRYVHHQVDDRLVCLRDVMPTLLDLCNIERPATVEGLSMVGAEKREQLLCEHYENELASRMLRTRRHKLIWYPAGNRFQLFDLIEDPNEMHDLAPLAESETVLTDLKKRLLDELWGVDLEKWVRDGQLLGESDKKFVAEPNRTLLGQRGWR